MPADAQIVVLVGALHVVGLVLAAALILVCLRSDPLSERSARDDGEEGGGGGSDRPAPRAPDRPRGGGLPLPDAVPARVRLRGPAPLTVGTERPIRRPGHEPLRRPVGPVPAGPMRGRPGHGRDRS